MTAKPPSIHRGVRFGQEFVKDPGTLACARQQENVPVRQRDADRDSTSSALADREGQLDALILRERSAGRHEPLDFGFAEMCQERPS